MLQNPLRRSARLLFILVALIAAWQPARAQTPAPALPGVYRSEAMDNELTGVTLIWQLSLFADHSAEVMTVFVTTDSVSYEAGAWALDNDGQVIVTLARRFDHQGGREHALEPPVEIPFVLDGDTLTAADFLIYGPRDLVVTRTKDKPVSLFDDDGNLRDELKTGLAEFPDSLFVGYYRTLEYEVRGAARWLGLELRDDGTARITFPPEEDAEAVYVQATWHNNGDGSITVVQIADIGPLGQVLHTYNPPLLFSDLTRTETGALFSTSIVLPDGSQPLFSRANPDGTFIYGDLPSAAGIYGGALHSEGEPPLGYVVMLNDDGTFVAGATPLDGKSAPSVALGTWAQAALTVTLTISAQVVFENGKPVPAAAEEPEPYAFALEDGALVSEGITLTPLPLGSPNAAAAPKPAAPPAAQGEDVTYMVSRAQLVAGNTIMLALNGDGTASISTQLGADAPGLLEFGAWAEDAEGTITLTLDRGLDQQPYAEPIVLVFQRTDERTLTATAYDAARYGDDLILYDTRNY